jgi:voltage-gated potassium channel
MGEGQTATWQRRLVDALFIAVIAAAVLAGMAETVPELSAGGLRLAQRLGNLALALFTMEYLLRHWFAPERHPELGPARARLRYARSFLGLVDLLVILPGYLALVWPTGRGVIELADLLALLKLARYTPSLGLVAAVFRNEARPLLGALMAMSVLLVIAAGCIYLLERDAQPEVFTSIPRSVWWAIVTMASVGYGDMVPVTVGGRIFGGFVMLLGIAVFAVPVGILATGFAQEVRRRDFVVTWHAVARVPLFASLDATRVAGITRLLKPQIVPTNHAVVRRGEPADAMFFIMKGAVEVDILPRPVRLGAGQFFGEIALIRDTVRTATVTAVEECQLLALDVMDFRRLTAQMPDLKERLEAVAAQRLKERQQAEAGSPPPAAPPT